VLVLKVVILDATQNHKADTYRAEKIICELKKKDIDTTVVNIGALNMLPCFGCEGCLRKTPGRCIMKDDTEKFMAPIANSNCMIGITDVRYGGYSSQYKIVVDKFALLGSPYYGMKNGKLLHRKRYQGLSAYYVLGLGSKLPQDEADNFHRLVKRNAMNMYIDQYGSFITDEKDMDRMVKKLVGKVIENDK